MSLCDQVKAAEAKKNRENLVQVLEDLKKLIQGELSNIDNGKLEEWVFTKGGFLKPDRVCKKLNYYVDDYSIIKSCLKILKTQFKAELKKYSVTLSIDTTRTFQAVDFIYLYTIKMTIKQ